VLLRPVLERDVSMRAGGSASGPVSRPLISTPKDRLQGTSSGRLSVVLCSAHDPVERWSADSDSVQGGFVLPADVAHQIAMLGVDVYATVYLEDEGSAENNPIADRSAGVLPTSRPD